MAVVSPYLRTRQTAELALAGTGIPLVVDERLRDRELGVLDLLTARGVQARLPGRVRPPGPARQVLLPAAGRRVLGRRAAAAARPAARGARGLSRTAGCCSSPTRRPCCSCVISPRRSVRPELMEIAHATAVANCSISSWRRVDGVLRPELLQRRRAPDGGRCPAHPSGGRRCRARLIRAGHHPAAAARLAAARSAGRQEAARHRAGRGRFPLHTGRRAAGRGRPRCAPAPAACNSRSSRPRRRR